MSSIIFCFVVIKNYMQQSHVNVCVVVSTLVCIEQTTQNIIDMLRKSEIPQICLTRSLMHRLMRKVMFFIGDIQAKEIKVLCVIRQNIQHCYDMDIDKREIFFLNFPPCRE